MSKQDQISLIQDLIIHYNSINWNIHLLFFPTNAALLGWIGIQIIDNKNPIISILSCLLGLVLEMSWIHIYRRHKKMLELFYTKINQLEEGEEVHRIISKYDEGFSKDYRAKKRINKIGYNFARLIISRWPIITKKGTKKEFHPYRTKNVLKLIFIIFMFCYISAGIYFALSIGKEDKFQNAERKHPNHKYWIHEQN